MGRILRGSAVVPVMLALRAAVLAECPGFGNCFVPHPTPGCDVTSCCAAVCSADPFCCSVQWDGACADLAFQYCACGGPNSGSCLQRNFTPGCQNQGCCEAVCLIDAFCCEVQWDEICAAAAEALCTCGGPSAGSCFEVHGTPACANAGCCTAVCGADPFCCAVEWDEICAAEGQAFCGCGGAGAGDCLRADGTPACAAAACCEAICAADPFCCEETWDDICARAAADQCAVCGNRAAGSCFQSNGTPACDLAGCCEAVCDADPFCCDETWDEICAAEAVVVCASCGGPAAGSCFSADGTPACTDAACCDAVCAVDAFCCNAAWDDVCVDEAIELCGHPSCPGGGPCAQGNPTPGCADALCCNVVCEADPFCCEFTWDQFCAALALDACTFCPGDTNGDAKVGVADLVNVLLDWATDGSLHGGDINGDGAVNVEDLADALHLWGPCV